MFNINIEDQDDKDYDPNIARIFTSLEIARESLSFRLGGANTFALQRVPYQYFEYLEILVNLFDSEF